MTRYSQQELSKYVAATEYKFLLHGGNKERTSFMPFQPASFLGLMWDCAAELGGTNFIDIGCGPGTKMAMARDVFGMAAYGIEYEGVMVSEARRWGEVFQADAFELIAGQPQIIPAMDVVWLYRPLRHPEAERELEDLIISQMKPGAILAGGAWETEVPSLGWLTIVDDWEIRHGAWMKR